MKRNVKKAMNTVKVCEGVGDGDGDGCEGEMLWGGKS